MRKMNLTIFALSLVLAAGCGSADDEVPAAAVEPQSSAPDVAFKPGAETAASTAKMSGPVTIAYRIIGQPLVGQPLAIDLAVTSSLGAQSVRLDYRVLDTSALRLGDSQTAFATISAGAEVTTGEQQVTVVPLREGRLYLNVAATVETSEGTMSTVTAIPIQVGDVRQDARPNGSLTTDEDGNAVRVLSGDTD